MLIVYFLTLMSQFDLSFWYWSILQSMFQRLKTASIRTKFSLRLQNLILKLYFIVYCTEHLQKILPALLIFTNLLCIANYKPGGGIIPTNKTVFLIKLNIIITIKACLIKALYHLPSSSIMDAAYTCKWHITNINWFKLGH